MSLSKNRENFETLVKRWISIEDNTIDATAKLMGQTQNPFVKIMINLIKLDSEKHKHILETIRLSLESAVVFSPADMVLIDSFIEKHDAAEKTAIETAEQALASATLPIPKLLLSHLLEDEKSHDAYMTELGKLKLYMAKQTQ